MKTLIRITSLLIGLVGISFGQVVAKADNGSFSATCANSAAGINSCDTSLGAHVGEITVMGDVTATDAQITVGAAHTLHVKGTLTIEAAPILLSKYAKLECDSNGGVGSGNIIEGTSNASFASMVRMVHQDGSDEAAYVEGCSFNASGANFSRGGIDATGFADKSRIVGNTVYGFTSGFGLYADDCSSCTPNDGFAMSLVEGNWINASLTSNTASAAGCIKVIHSNASFIFLSDVHFTNNECLMNSSYTGATVAPVIFQNNQSGAYLRGMFVDGLVIQGVPASGIGLYVHGVYSSNFKNVHIYSGSYGAEIDLSSPGTTFDNITMWNGGTTIYDTTGPSNLAINTPVVEHYLASNYSAPSQAVFGVTRLHAFGAPPSGISSSGFGTSPSYTIETNSTDNFGTVVVTAGTSPSSSGTLSLTWSTGWEHAAGCAFSLYNGSGTWNARATLIGGSNTTSALTLDWDNNGTNLAASSSYRIGWSCGGR